MKFFKYYIGILLLCVTAIIAAKFLILTPETVALMYLDSKMYEEAMRRYEKMLAAGNHSGNVIIPLAKLYARNGEVKKAIGLLVRYINKNPDLLNAEAVLSQISNNAANLDEYGKLIGKTPDFSYPNIVLLELSSWYESVLQDEKQIEVLTGLAKLPDNKNTEIYYNKLLSYYALDRKFDGPSTLVKQLIINEDPQNRKKSFQSLLIIMVKAEQYQKAMVLACRYLESLSPRNSFEVERIADVFLSAGQTRMASEICRQFLSKKDGPAIMQICNSRINMEKGDRLIYMEEMKKDFYSNLIKSGRLYEVAVKTAMKYGDSNWVKDLLLRADLTKSTQEGIHDFAFYALKNRDAKIAEILKHRLPPETLKVYPYLNYIIKSAMERIPVGTMASLAIKSTELDEDDKLQLAYIMFHYDCLDEALLMIKDSSASKLFQFFKIRDLVKVVLNSDSPDAFMDKYEKEYTLLGKNRGSICMDMLFLLAAASGNEDRLNKLIASHPEISLGLLVDAYSLASSYGEYDTAIVLAEELYRKNKKDEYRFFLATALMDSGDFTKALKLLSQLKKNMRAADSLFLKAVTRYIELCGYPRISSEVRKEIEPTLNTVLNRKDVTVTELKRAALCLAAMGRKEKFEQIYLKLCMGDDFPATDIDEFVYMCKRSPGKDVREWFLKQAKTGKWEKFQILSWLNQLGMENETVDIVERVYKEVEFNYLVPYLAALHATGRDKKMNEVLARYNISQVLKLGQSERISLINLLSKTDQLEMARRLLGSLSAKDLLANLSPADIASLFIAVKMEKEGLELFGGGVKNPTKKAMHVMLFIHAFIGNEKFVKLWLESGSKKPENVLINLYYFAFRNKQIQLSEDIARCLFKLYDSQENRLRLAEALIAGKHFDEAIALISDYAEEDGNVGRFYLSAVSGLAEERRFSKRSPIAEKFLRICDNFIKSPDTPESTIVSVAFALSSTGYHDKAKPLFHDLALANPAIKDPFTKMYLYSTVMAPERKDFKLITELLLKSRIEDEQKVLELLDAYDMQGQIMIFIETRHGNNVPLHAYAKYLNCLLKCRNMETFNILVGKLPPPQSFSEEDQGSIFESLILAGKNAEAAAFYEALKNSASPGSVRRMGLYYANIKRYDKAIPIFFELAKADNTLLSPDLSILISLPGISENKEIVEWLASQANKADSESQLTWLEYLNFIKHPEKVIEILKKYYVE